MLISALFRHPSVLKKIILRFLRWYFVEVPHRFIVNFFAYIAALNEIFSFFFLIRTLLKPWKSITDRYPDRGFNIGRMAEAFALNTTSRMIGFIFRITAFVIGMVISCAFVAVFLGIFIVWIAFPIVLVLDFLYFL
ncbi:MAG: hypothetical protein V1926_03405 [Candidatus Peregrinibacteria bacterium]